MPGVKDILGGAPDEEEAVEPMEDEEAEETEEAAPADAPPPTNNTTGDGSDGDPTPEEQAQYEKLVLAGVDLMTRPKSKTHDKIMAVLKGGADNPAKALSDAAVFAFLGVDQAGGRKTPLDMIPHVCTELIEQAGELAVAAKLFPVDQKTLDDAAALMMSDIADKYDTTPQQLEEMMAKYTPEQQEAVRAKMDAKYNPQNQPMQRGTAPAGNIASQVEE